MPNMVARSSMPSSDINIGATHGGGAMPYLVKRPRWQSFTDSDLAAISNVNASSLFPALAQRMSQTR